MFTIIQVSYILTIQGLEHGHEQHLSGEVLRNLEEESSKSAQISSNSTDWLQNSSIQSLNIKSDLKLILLATIRSVSDLTND